MARRIGANKEVRRMVRALQNAGCEVEQSGGSHILIRHNGRIVATMSGTAGDGRAYKNLTSDLRRSGVPL